LIDANNDRSFSNILSSTKAIAFFGTPHKGSRHADLASILSNIAESISKVTLAARLAGLHTRSDLIDLLKNPSAELDEINMSFNDRLEGLEIASFYEQDTIRGFTELVCFRS
jgi:hypothetical protein